MSQITTAVNDDLQNEIEAINSIYGDGSVLPTGDVDVYVLRLPQHTTTLNLRFPIDYPSAPPQVLGSHSSGDNARRGEAAHTVEVFRDILGHVFQPGQVCLFDSIEEMQNHPLEEATIVQEQPFQYLDHLVSPIEASTESLEDIEAPPWSISEVVVELKSVFVARAASVTSPDHAKQYLKHLLETDKKVRSATHNITAWRIKGENGVTYQDCDDDGETAAGGRVLHLMQLMDLWNVMVVVTRWYGGHQLGPKRFSIINTVARDAFVKGDFVEETGGKKKGKR